MSTDDHALSTVPDWARDAVWYQIFPERFCNGCPASNPTPADIGAEGVPGWRVSPWGMDWYARLEWEHGAGDHFRAVGWRRFGGDLVGVMEKLDYLQQLGVNAIYLNPIFMAPSLHKYDASCLHHVDPTFGPDRAGDLKALREARETEDPATWIWTAADRFFLELVAEVHRRGMRIVIDGVFNHTGTRFFAFRDLQENGRQSRYKDWYKITRWRKQGGFAYKGWFGHKGLPEFKQKRGNLSPPVKQYIFDITRRWMAPGGHPSRGVDGWRLDVAFCVPHAFWKEWRVLCKSLNPEAYLCGEIVSLAVDYLRGDELDAVMNYMWTYPSVSFFSPGTTAISAPELRTHLESVLNAYPADVSHVLQNLMDSHDVGRVLTMLENPDVPKMSWDDYFGATRVMGHPEVVTTRPRAAAKAALKQFGLFQMTYLGAPMIYYGTEVGMWGANDPDNRQPMLWQDIAYEPESLRIDGPCAPSKREPDLELLDFYKRAIALRREHEVFRRGELGWIDTADSRLLAFSRSLPDCEVMLLFNASDRETTHRLDAPGVDLWNGMVPVGAGTIDVPPRGWRVVKLR